MPRCFVLYSISEELDVLDDAPHVDLVLEDMSYPMCLVITDGSSASKYSAAPFGQGLGGYYLVIQENGSD